MSEFNSFRDVIDAWPSRRDFAADISASLAAVNKMHEVDSIRAIYFAAICEASRRLHGDGAVSAEVLCALAARAHSARKGDGTGRDAA